MTRIWRQDYRERRFHAGDNREWDTLSASPIYEHKPIADQFPLDTVVYIKSQAAARRTTLETASMSVVSEKLKAILEGFHVRAEFIRLQLKRKGGKDIRSPFHCFNPLEQLDCFDAQHSEFGTRRFYCGYRTAGFERSGGV